MIFIEDEVDFEDISKTLLGVERVGITKTH